MNADWKCVQLGDYSHIILGGTPKTSEPAYWGGDIFWASVTDFNTDKKLYNTEKTITEKGLNESNTKLLDVGDIIISARGTVGKTVVCGIPMAFNQSCYALRAKSEDLYQDFLYYLINYYVSQLKKKATGGVFDTIVTDTLKSLNIVLPPLPVQQKIASILSAYDDLIENNLKRIKILEEMAQMIYREWFVNFRFPEHEKVKMVKSELGMIPEGWLVKKVGEMLSKIERKPKIKKEDYLSAGEIPTIDQGLEFIGGYTNEDKALHTDPLPIIVFGDHTRIVKYIDFPFASGADGTQLLYPTNEDLMPAYFYYAISSVDLTSFAYARHFKFLKEHKILIPQGFVLKKFNETVGLMLNKMSSIRAVNMNLRKTRDLLLPKLINGGIDVESVDLKLSHENN